MPDEDNEIDPHLSLAEPPSVVDAENKLWKKLEELVMDKQKAVIERIRVQQEKYAYFLNSRKR